MNERKGGSRMANWDTETADNCKLPGLIPDICERCRTYAYCHRQLSFSKVLEVERDDERRSNSISIANNGCSTRE